MASYDLAVLGSGPGGYVAAIRASQLSLKVVLIEAENLGGICLNWGCIPTKALLYSADVYRHIEHANKYGIYAQNISYNIDEVVQRSRNVATQLSSGVKHLLAKNKVDVIYGYGRILDKSKIIIDRREGGQQIIECKDMILATGARVRDLFNIDNEVIWSYKAAMVPKIVPKDLLVIGSGAIGVEFASFFNTLGSNTTVVEAMDRIVVSEDKDISNFLDKSMQKQGITIMKNTKIVNVVRDGDSAIVDFGNNVKKSFDRVIVSVGVLPNTEDIGLGNIGLNSNGGILQVNDNYQLDVAGVHAIGDITAGPWLAHKASHEAIICVEKIAGLKPHKLDVNMIPRCTYCYPQIASIGLSEQQAKENGYNIDVGMFPLIGNGKAIAMGDDQGFIKTIFNKTDNTLLGAHMIGPEVTELIQGFSIAKANNLTNQDLINTIFPHPTLSESMHESVLSSLNRVIHI